MKKLYNIINKLLFTKPDLYLYGRWNLDYDHIIQDRKVFLANMDNCGCCEIINDKIENNIEENIMNDELFPYFL